MKVKVEDLQEGMVFDAEPAVEAGGYSWDDSYESSVILAAECELFEVESVKVCGDKVFIYAAYPHNVETRKGVEVKVYQWRR